MRITIENIDDVTASMIKAQADSNGCSVEEAAASILKTYTAGVIGVEIKRESVRNLKNLHEKLLNLRDGKPYASSVDIINEIRSHD